MSQSFKGNFGKDRIDFGKAQQVILVNEQDEPTGEMEKSEVHEKGLLHRAFSIFIFNSRGEMLLQQRALSKYHSAGLWSNACCSHPFPNEEINFAASRRLNEELGFQTSLEKAFDFLYKASFENGLTEHEFDHVFIGRYDGVIKPDPEEVMDVSFRSLTQVKRDLSDNPETFTAWFRIAFPKVEEWMRSRG